MTEVTEDRATGLAPSFLVDRRNKEDCNGRYSCVLRWRHLLNCLRGEGNLIRCWQTSLSGLS